MVFWEEKRQSPRVKLRTPVRYQVRGTPEFDNVISDNISRNGVGFINNKFIAPNTILMLELNVLSRVLKPIGKITRSEQLARSDRYSLGVEFLELNKNEEHYLADYINLRTGRLL